MLTREKVIKYFCDVQIVMSKSPEHKPYNVLENMGNELGNDSAQ